MVEKEDKFIIFNKRDVYDLMEISEDFQGAIRKISKMYRAYRDKLGKDDNAAYIVCNQDEPYAAEVWQTILKGEEAKLSK